VVGIQVTYLDTHAVAALYQGDLSPFSPAALRVIDEEDDLRISPMVLLELEYLHEIKRIKATEERWTRDPFDRLILAQARLHGARPVTRDRLLRSRYPHALG
jgi:PIN domain nuclease of toxin-antitoxin system